MADFTVARVLAVTVSMKNIQINALQSITQNPGHASTTANPRVG